MEWGKGYGIVIKTDLLLVVGKLYRARHNFASCDSVMGLSMMCKSVRVQQKIKTILPW